jgi:hypothetical protein
VIDGRNFYPFEDLTPVSASRRNPEFFDEHADDRRESDGAGGNVPVGEADLLDGHRIGSSIQRGRHMQMGMIWTREVWTWLPVKDQEFSCIVIKQRVDIHPCHDPPSGTVPDVFGFVDFVQVSDLQREPARSTMGRTERSWFAVGLEGGCVESSGAVVVWDSEVPIGDAAEGRAERLEELSCRDFRRACGGQRGSA